MAEWSVAVEMALAVGEGAKAIDRIDELLERLRDHAAVASYTPTELEVRMTVEEDTPQDAALMAIAPLFAALREIGLSAQSDDILRLEVQTMEDLDREIAASDVPELVGVTELAEALGVSKQRASELARAKNFPPPVAHLASGPVWRKASIGRFVDQWPRKPGRPPKAEALEDA